MLDQLVRILDIQKSSDESVPTFKLITIHKMITDSCLEPLVQNIVIKDSIIPYLGNFKYMQAISSLLEQASGLGIAWSIKNYIIGAIETYQCEADRLYHQCLARVSEQYVSRKGGVAPWTYVYTL